MKDGEYFHIMKNDELKDATKKDPESVCSICLIELFENLDENLEIVQLNLCQHLFHKECIEVFFIYHFLNYFSLLLK